MYVVIGVHLTTGVFTTGEDIRATCEQALSARLADLPVEFNVSYLAMGHDELKRYQVRERRG